MKAKQHTLIVLLVFVLSAGAALTLLTHANQESIFLQLFQVFSQCFSCHCHNIQMQHILDLFHDRRNPSCIIEELCRPFSCRTDVEQIVCASVQTVKCISVNLNSKFLGNCRNM